VAAALLALALASAPSSVGPTRARADDELPAAPEAPPADAQASPDQPPAPAPPEAPAEAAPAPADAPPAGPPASEPPPAEAPAEAPVALSPEPSPSVSPEPEVEPLSIVPPVAPGQDTTPHPPLPPAERVKTPAELSTEDIIELDKLDADAERRAKTRAKILRQPYPGTYVGARIGFGAGEALVPRFGVGQLLGARARYDTYTPYIGLEAGYAPNGWGAGVALDGGFSLLNVDYLESRPFHFDTTIELIRAPLGGKLRWSFGFSPYSYYKMIYSSGESLTLRGIGVRAGVHLKGESYLGKYLEPYAYFTIDRFTEVEAGFGNNTANYSPADFVGTDTGLFVFMFVVGFQLDLSW
jgi:hypothetical protein